MTVQNFKMTGPHFFVLVRDDLAQPAEDVSFQPSKYQYV